jgi:hypothetical protein
MVRALETSSTPAFSSGAAIKDHARVAGATAPRAVSGGYR